MSRERFVKHFLMLLHSYSFRLACPWSASPNVRPNFDQNSELEESIPGIFTQASSVLEEKLELTAVMEKVVHLWFALMR